MEPSLKCRCGRELKFDTQAAEEASGSLGSDYSFTCSKCGTGWFVEERTPPGRGPAIQI